jgi:hypothetical protein
MFMVRPTTLERSPGFGSLVLLIAAAEVLRPG